MKHDIKIDNLIKKWAKWLEVLHGERRLAQGEMQIALEGRISQLTSDLNELKDAVKDSGEPSANLAETLRTRPTKKLPSAARAANRTAGRKRKT